MSESIGRHIASAAPRVLVVDGSKVARKLIAKVLHKELEGAEVITCADGAEAQAAMQGGVVDFVSVALRLPDMDGLELASYIRDYVDQTFVPIVVVSGDVDERLRERTLGDDVTDYFDKALGYEALAHFIRGYVCPEDVDEGEVLYVEDSRVVALATTRMLEKYGLTIRHVVSAEDALAMLDTARHRDRIGADVLLTDLTLKGQLTGADLVRRVRGEFGYSKALLPVLVMTGDSNPDNQASLIRLGANDLVEKPVEERQLVAKLLFQLRLARQRRADVGAK